VKLGVQLPNLGLLRGREAFVRTAQAAEALGYDSVWTGDHVVYPVESSSPYPYHRGGAYSPTPLVAYDALVVLSVVAGCTGGRVILGVGAGWLVEELEALDAPDPSRRGEVLEEWIAILRACWSDEVPRYDGRFYRFDPVHFDPLPARAVPILVGGNSRGALRRAGAIGDGWFGTAVTLDEARASIAAVRRHAEEAGRDPAALTVGAGYTVRITAEEREHERHLLGTPTQIAERVHALAEVGFDHIELRFAPMRDPGERSLEAALEMIEQFAEDVAPAARV
jgi:alkanesulfonate monooxygenase SsuD/methylene tetrahydromethanopterin reductase-like flavin-dependent oxidoreductase (luciferase family)